MCDLQTTNRQDCLVMIELVTDKFLLYIVNKHQCNLFTVCSFFNKLFTVTGNNNAMYNKNRKSSSISLIESEEFMEILNRAH